VDLGQWYVSRGRITRRTFWLCYVLPLLGLGILASVADLAVGFSELETAATSTSASAAWDLGPIAIVVTLLTLVPSISSTVTRLHDQDRSAVWLLVGLVPIIGWIVLLVLCGAVPGTPATNTYGPSPVGRTTAEPGYPPSCS
jgi:uncharacterized membrane protein YhaH (DUF805 family)